MTQGVATVEKRRMNTSHLESATDWQPNWYEICTPPGKHFGNVNRAEAASCASSEYILNQFKNDSCHVRVRSAVGECIRLLFYVEIAKVSNSSKRSLVYYANHNKELQPIRGQKWGCAPAKCCHMSKGKCIAVSSGAWRSRSAAVPPRQKPR